MTDLIDRDKLLEDTQISATVSGPRSTAKEVAQAILDVSNYIINIIKKEPTVDIELHAQWEQPSCFDEENNVYSSAQIAKKNLSLLVEVLKKMDMNIVRIAATKWTGQSTVAVIVLLLIPIVRTVLMRMKHSPRLADAENL